MSSFCILPFIKLSNKHTGEFRVCCNQYHDPILNEHKQPLQMSTSTIEQVWNSPHLKDLRKQFLRGEKPTACSKCWMEEEYGGISMRQDENARNMEKYRERIEEASQGDGHLQSGPKILDLRLGSICNLACKSCFPMTSSSWGVHYKDVLKDSSYFNTFYDLDNYQSALYWERGLDIQKLAPYMSTLQELYLAGGEPLLMPKSLELIDLLVSSGWAQNIHLRFHTNLTQMNDHIIKNLSCFKKVSVQGSIDAIGNRNDWLRQPSRWDAVVQNMQKFLQLKNANFKVALTMSVYNIIYINEIYNWFVQLKKIYANSITLAVSPVYEPSFLSIKTLPINLKSKALEDLEKLISTEVNPVIAADFLCAASMLRQESPLQDRVRLKEYTLRVDQKSSQKFATLFPQLAEELYCSDRNTIEKNIL